jgi:predicted AlkP superfamily phosphohydrolase/phosphomutase
MKDELDKVMEEVKAEEKKLEKKKKKEFVTAKNYDEHLYSKDKKQEVGIEETIKRYWNRLGNSVIVECPNCGRRQPTHTCISKKCVSCHKSFTIYPKNKISRVVYCPPNLRMFLLTVHSLQVDGKYPNIL